MPVINFDVVEDAADFRPIPKGKYLCTISGIEELHTKSGDDMWRINLQVISGDFVGRTFFDNWAFSPPALKRIKLICSRMGIPTTGTVAVTPSMFLNKNITVETETESYLDDENNPQEKTKPKFAGYYKDSEILENNPQTPANQSNSESDDIPF